MGLRLEYEVDVIRCNEKPTPQSKLCCNKEAGHEGQHRAVDAKHKRHFWRAHG